MSENKSNRPISSSDKMEKLISLCKRRGFIFQSSEIYGGFGAYDYGPLGVELKNNIKREWRRMFVLERSDMFGVDAAIIMHPKVWEASGHLKNFSDPLVDCKKCHKRFRADHILELAEAKPFSEKVEADKNVCPECAGELTATRQFNLMFKTFIGPVEEESSVSYLRPETAGGIFTNFKNTLQSMRARVPFGLAQIGKAFRNEITTENYIFRTREFEQMEVEYFINPKNWEKSFEEWVEIMKKWCEFLGLKKEEVVLKEIAEADRAFYSKRTIDFEYKYPFGQKELYGLAYRTDYDLSQHQKFSGEDLTYSDPVSGEKFLPHVIEPSLGVDRSVLAVLLSAYSEVEARSGEENAKHETEVVLKLPYKLAPIKVAILPLSKKEPLAEMAKNIDKELRKNFVVQYDETGSIGKRYRRQDEIGTPFCLTIDFDSLEDKKVTIRDRDTMKQERVAVEDLHNYLTKVLSS